MINSITSSYKDLYLSEWYPQLISFKAPVALGAGYLLVVSSWSAHNRRVYKDTKPPKTGPLMTLFAALHNFALLAFSFLTFIHTAPVMYNLFKTQGFDNTLCDAGQNAWNNGLFYWGWLFYLSKYYEFVDTLIILIKGRVPMFLQTYHHTGAVFAMWSLIASKSNVTWIFVCLNSFIHTIMYFYYLMTTINIRPPGKQIITYLQMIQFVCGNSIAFYTLTLNDCMTPFSRNACWFNLAYVTPLLYLFAQFAKKAYFKPTANKSKSDQVKQE